MVIADVVPEGADVAYVNFPNHRNAGDSALWLAGEAVLAERGVRVVARTGWNQPVEALARRLTPGTIVVLNAGGNLGDLYPHGQQRTRERVLELLGRHPVVQLPQSIHFADPAAEQRMAELFARHGDVTVLCREVASLSVAARWPGVDARACPDLVFSLGALRRRAAASVEVLWLARRDPEARHPVPEPTPGTRVLDWLEPLPGEAPWAPGHQRASALCDRLLGHQRPTPRLGRTKVGSTLAASTFAPIARGWLNRGLKIVGQGHVVVTDRLHAHLLAWLSGIPSVVLDNSYGKVHGVVRETTLGSSHVALASSIDEARQRAAEMLERVR